MGRRGIENTYLLENTLYGSSRLGVADYGKSRLVASVALADVIPPLPPLPTYASVYQSDRGNKRYELSNHLGNVLVVVSDFVDGEDTDGDGQAEHYAAGVVSASDYYPYGWGRERFLTVGRNESLGDFQANEPQADGHRQMTAEYRYGFNGQETDKEWQGRQAASFRFRIHDPRIGKFLSVDPLTPEYPWNSSYAFAENIIIWGRELEGLEVMFSTSSLDNVTPIYKVQKGDGFTQISEYIKKEHGIDIDWKILRDFKSNKKYSKHITEDRDNPYNPAYEELNMNPGVDYLELPTFKELMDLDRLTNILPVFVKAYENEGRETFKINDLYSRKKINDFMNMEGTLPGYFDKDFGDFQLYMDGTNQDGSIDRIAVNFGWDIITDFEEFSEEKKKRDEHLYSYPYGVVINGSQEGAASFNVVRVGFKTEEEAFNFYNKILKNVDYDKTYKPDDL